MKHVLLIHKLNIQQDLDTKFEVYVVDDNIQAIPILKGGKLSQLLDPSLGSDYNHCHIERMILAATLCIRRSPRLRPQICLVSLACANLHLLFVLPLCSFKYWSCFLIADIETPTW